MRSKGIRCQGQNEGCTDSSKLWKETKPVNSINVLTLTLIADTDSIVSPLFISVNPMQLNSVFSILHWWGGRIWVDLQGIHTKEKKVDKTYIYSQAVNKTHLFEAKLYSSGIIYRLTMLSVSAISVCDGTNFLP